MASTLDPGSPSLFPWRFNREWISSGLAQYQCTLSGRRRRATSNLMTHGWNFNYTLQFCKALKTPFKSQTAVFLMDLREICQK